MSPDTPTVRLTFLESSSVPVDMAVEVDIDAEERTDAIFVPAEAVVRAGGQAGREAALYIAAGNTAERRAVMVGVETDDRVEITSGIKAGELVITRGQSGLPDGAAISVDLGN